MLFTPTASSQRHRGARHGVRLHARLWAAFLMLLIALPFTAPFSRCDLATLLASPAPHATGHSVGSSQLDATNLAPVVTMEDDDQVSELKAPLTMTETVATVVTAEETVCTSLVVRTSSLPLRL